MSEHEIRSNAGGSSKLPLIIGGLVLLVALAVGTWVTMDPSILPGSAAKRVGSIDQEKIITLDEFKNAEKELQAFSEKKKKEFEAAVKAAGERPDEAKTAELQNLYRKIQLEIQQEQNKKLNPLKTRAEAAVATVARSKGLTVVLDKRIVVYGVPDITEDVQKVFQQQGELSLPAEQDTSKSPVAYFDQDVVRSLKVFQEADLKLFQYQNDLMGEYQKKSANLGASEKEALQRELTARLEAFKEQTMAPLFQKVTASVNEVSQTQGIALVLDKQNVMYGGRNITDAVVETFLQKVGQPADAAAPAAGSSPAAPAAGASPAQNR